MSRKLYVFARLGLIVVVGSAGIEGCLPRPRNPPVAATRSIEAYMPVPREVAIIMARSCKDCHSLETRWPWYSRLPIVSAILRDDVEHARSQMNLSDWGAQADLGKEEESGVLNGICEELRSANMPPRSYRIMHPVSRVSQADIETVCKWTDRTVSHRLRPAGSPEDR